MLSTCVHLPLNADRRNSGCRRNRDRSGPRMPTAAVGRCDSVSNIGTALSRRYVPRLAGIPAAVGGLLQHMPVRHAAHTNVEPCASLNDARVAQVCFDDPR